MPISVEIKPNEKLVVLSHEGSVHDDEFLSSYRALFDDPRYHISYNLLVDLRRAISSVRGKEALRDVAWLASLQLANSEVVPKVAVVAPQDISFGLARMYEAFSDSVPWEFKVFRSADAALSWLGLDGDVVGNLDQDAQPLGSTDSD